MIHDLVEIYAGDTPLYSSNMFLKISKNLREKKALKSLEEQLEESPFMVQTIKDYFYQVDNEGKFVKSVDKLLPVLNIYLDGGYAWNSHNLCVEDLYNSIFPKIKDSPLIKSYFLSMLDLIKENSMINKI